MLITISINSYYKPENDNQKPYGIKYTDLYTQTFTTTNLVYVSGIIELWQRYLHNSYLPVFQHTDGSDADMLSFGVDFYEAVVATRCVNKVVQRFVAIISLA